MTTIDRILELLNDYDKLGKKDISIKALTIAILEMQKGEREEREMAEYGVGLVKNNLTPKT